MTDGAHDDEQILDELFDRVLEAIEEGRAPDLDRWLAGREHLRRRADELVAVARSLAPEASPRTPEIPGYEDLQPIGRGAMGRVFRARQVSLGDRAVALKVLPAASFQTPRSKRRFLTEARALARIRHPNVVTVHDVIQGDEYLAFSMEWIDGATLAELVDLLRSLPGDRANQPLQVLASCSPRFAARNSPPADRGLPLDSAATRLGRVAFFSRVAADVARALAEVHRSGLVHRDVKPSNILLRRDGNALLSDFGLVRDPEGALDTRSGEYLGTPGYSSPEQLKGEWAKVGPASDVYSLGVTLYHALALRLPFSVTTRHRLLAEIESGSCPPLRRVDPRISRDLETIVARAMDPIPSSRYGSAGDLADDLERMLRLEPIHARPLSLAERLLRALRHRGRIVASALGGAALMAFLAVLAWNHRQDQLAASALERERVRSGIAAAEFDAWNELLEPLRADLVPAALYLLPRDVGSPFTEQGANTSSAMPSEDVLLAYQRAIDHLDRALELDPRAAQMRLALEREVLAAGLAAVRGDPGPPPELSVALRSACPRTASAIESFPVRAEESGGSPPDQAAALDLQLLGLFSYLTWDLRAALSAWEQLELQTPSTTAAPLPPYAALGLAQLYLESGRFIEAYTTLKGVARDLPRSGLVRMTLADAAVQAGVHRSTVEKLLEDVRRLAEPDPYDGLDRIEADFLWAKGELEESRAAYRRYFSGEYKRARLAPRARLHYARHLKENAEWEEIVRYLLPLVHKRPLLAEAHERLRDAIEQWWAGMSALQRLRVARSSLIELMPAMVQYTLPELAETVALCDDRLQTLSSVGGELSISSQGASVGEIGRSLRGLSARHVRDSCRVSKELLAISWCAGFEHLGALTVRRGEPLLSLVSDATLLSWRSVRDLVSPRPQVVSAGRDTASWTSRWQGPESARRTVGNGPGSGWEMRWRSPRGGFGDILVGDGVAVFQNDPEVWNQFAMVELETGDVTREFVIAAAQEQQRSPAGVILGGRVFLSLSHENSRKQPVEGRIECWDLATGTRQWTWSCGRFARLSGLTGATLDNGEHRVYAYVTDVDPGLSNLDGRVVCLDADSPASGLWTGLDSNGPCIAETPGFLSTFAAAPSVMGLAHTTGPTQWQLWIHQRYFRYGPNNQRSFALRGYDADSLAPVANLALSNDSLSDSKFTAVPCPVVLRDGLGFVYDSNGELRCFDLLDRRELWNRPIASSFSMIYPLVLESCVVVFDPMARRIRGYDREDGRPLWEVQAPESTSGFAGCVLDGDVVLCAFKNGDVYCLDNEGRLYGPVHSVPNMDARHLIAAAGYFLARTDTEFHCYAATSPVVLGAELRGQTSDAVLHVHALGAEPRSSGILVIQQTQGEFGSEEVSVEFDARGRWSTSLTGLRISRAREVVLRLHVLDARGERTHSSNEVRVRAP